MVTKRDMLNEIDDILNEYCIKSTNGRHYTYKDNVNFVFDTKYYNLTTKRAKDNYFIEDSLTDFDYDLFRQDLIEFIDFEYPNNFIDWDNSGFYGRSSGNYNVSFDLYIPAKIWEYGIDTSIEEFDYVDVKEALKDVKNSLKLMEVCKTFMYDYFTFILDNLFTYEYTKHGHLILRGPNNKELYLQIDYEVSEFLKTIGADQEILETGDMGIYDDSIFGYEDLMTEI